MAETNFIDGLEPLPHHIVLEEGQPSLFVDTPLDLQLKTLGVDTLIVCGVASDIGIEFTCRHAAALGYFTVVIEERAAPTPTRLTSAASPSCAAGPLRWSTPPPPVESWRSRARPAASRGTHGSTVSPSPLSASARTAYLVRVRPNGDLHAARCNAHRD
jgi:hypothetical protein